MVKTIHRTPNTITQTIGVIKNLFHRVFNKTYSIVVNEILFRRIIKKESLYTVYQIVANVEQRRAAQGV